MTSPRPVPPFFVEPWKALNMCSRARCGTPGPVVGEIQDYLAAFAVSTDRDLALAGVRTLDRLRGVAHQVAQHAEQMIAVGIDAKAIVHVCMARAPRAASPGYRRLPDQRLQQKQIVRGRGFRHAAELKRGIAEADGAVERGNELWHEALNRWI